MASTFKRTEVRQPLLLGMLFMAKSVVLAIGCAFALALSGKAEAVERPNIIFVMADDLGFGDIEPFGQTRFKTPALAQMAAEGVRLTQFYSASTVCAPAREALMRGRHTGRTFRHSNTSDPLRPSDVTFASVLKRAGYRTAMIGKWALGLPGSTGTPDQHGFDYWFGFLDQGLAHRHYPKEMLRNGQPIFYSDNTGNTGTTYSNDEFTREAARFIEENAAQPFLLYLPLTLPHADITAPAELIGKFAGQFPEVVFSGGHYAPQATPNAAFAAMVTAIDGTMATLLATLKRLGIDDKTLVIFTSDNGPVAVGGHDPKFFNSSGGLRGGKRDLYEGGIRVPFIARWPGHIPPSGSSQTPASFEDIFSTLLDLAGLPIGKNTTTGRSILPVLLDPKTSLPERRLYWAWSGRTLNGDPGIEQSWGKEVMIEAVRLGRWKAVRFERSAGVELYDLEEDREERNELSSRMPDKAAELRQIMEHEFKPD